MHDYIGFTITIVLVLAGILFNRSDFKELRKELIDLRKDMATLETSLRKEIADLRVELSRDFVKKGN